MQSILPTRLASGWPAPQRGQLCSEREALPLPMMIDWDSAVRSFKTARTVLASVAAVTVNVPNPTTALAWSVLTLVLTGTPSR
jgi:hypothetical protein